MFARVSTFEGAEGKEDALKEGFEGATDPLQEIDGFTRAYFLLGDAGKGMSITLWDSREALDASAAAANQLREDATQPSGATITSVESYEVAIAVND